MVRGLPGAVPLLGYYAASAFNTYVSKVDHWIILGLLALIGGNMIREAFVPDAEGHAQVAHFDWRHMLPLAIACSIDAFAVGVSFAFMRVNILFSIISIAVTTGVLSGVGLYIGRAFGAAWSRTAQVTGGLVLIAIGVKVVLEHLGIIAW